MRGKEVIWAVLILLAAQAVIAASFTPATGGEAISADTFASFTNLTGLVITEAASGEIGVGVIVLNAPEGFVFDTADPAPAVNVTRTFGNGSSNKNINNVANGTVLSVLFTEKHINFTVTDGTNGEVHNMLTWLNIRIRPVSSTPLANGNITKTGTSAITGVPENTALGALTEVPGALAGITLAPASSIIDQAQQQTYTVAGYDAFGNYREDLTGSSSYSITPAAGGSWNDSAYTSEAAGVWTVDSASGGFSDTAMLTVLDITPPVITVLGSDPLTWEAATTFVDPGATADDDTDGNITAAIVALSDVDTSALGTYTVTYSINDSAGNSAIAVRYVTVVDTTPPEITLAGQTTIELTEGQQYIDTGATAWDAYQGDITGAIAMDSTLTHWVGTYALTYAVNDSSGNNASASRTVLISPDHATGFGPDAYSHFSKQTAPQGEAPRGETPGPVAATPSAPAASTQSESPAAPSIASEAVGAEAAGFSDDAVVQAALDTVENPITGAVTGRGRTIDWSWIAGLGLLILVLIGIAATYHRRHKNDPEHHRKTFFRNWKL